MKSITTKILWTVYICLLAALLPHTAWAFRQFEPGESASLIGSFTWADLVSYVVAFAFEAAIAALTHKLAKHIEEKSKKLGKKSRWEKFESFYLNPFALGLAVATVVSALANYAHAVQFGRSLTVFGGSPFWQTVYSVAFGGALPFVSLIFARVLSNVVDTEGEPDPELEAARASLAEVKKQLRESEQRARVNEDRARTAEGKLTESEQLLKISEDRARQVEEKFAESERLLQLSEDRRVAAEERAKLAEDRFGAIGDLVKYLFSEDKRRRIIAARQQWPQLPNSAIAIVAGSSPSYVTEVLKEFEAVEVESAV
jgi:hypothetical protein